MVDSSSIYSGNLENLSNVISITKIDSKWIVGQAYDNDDVKIKLKFSKAHPYARYDEILKMFVYSDMIYQVCGNFKSSCYIYYDYGWAEGYEPNREGLDPKISSLHAGIISALN